ncbi:hypothetical protein GCM10022210_13600 [Mucilaginibacter dorajii]|uniref:Uncharacterized protein n=1 Tax=Mucilaginibacter dorajii TaxID=692994 RepID=A0ABP7PIP4_9SPHI
MPNISNEDTANSTMQKIAIAFIVERRSGSEFSDLLNNYTHKFTIMKYYIIKNQYN